MNTIKSLAVAVSLMLPLAVSAQSNNDRYDNQRYDNQRYENQRDNRYHDQRKNQRHYTVQDEGRRFNDGTQVVCRDVVLEENSQDKNRVGGTVAGALVGGLIGNQVGSGSGRRLATVGGAVAGGAIGRKIQGDNQENNGERIVETRCERVRR